MRRISILLVAALCLFAVSAKAQVALPPGFWASAGSSSVSNEEFVGPFPTWTNVKTACGATGNGSTDDTAAIQTCLNGLSSSAPVIYFPAGTYKITTSLVLGAATCSTATSTGAIYMSMIGDNPATTTLLWGGSPGGTMLCLNGVTFARIDRLTFNGQSNAAVLVDQSWGGGGNYADSGNEYTDDVFENGGVGFRCGFLGFQCSEISLLRDQFLNNSVAGVSLGNPNALDIFIWYSLFNNNAIGVTNFYGSGNFHVFQSIFEGSTSEDIGFANSGVFNLRNNYSIGSNHFLFAGGTSSATNMTLQGNTILDTTAGSYGSVFQQDLGPLVLIDNVIRSASGVVSGPVVTSYGDLFSMGNTYTVGSSVDCAGGSTSPIYANGGLHCHTVNDQIVNRSTVNPGMPTLPPTPPNLGRTIYEAAPTGVSTNPCSFASPCDPQTAITNAAVGCSNNVAHIEPGSYSISTTVTVPANCPVQIIGDGSYSQLAAAVGLSTNPVLRLVGPSKATLSNFFINGVANTANGIEVTDADQSGSRVFMDQALLGSSTTNLFIDALDYTNVEVNGLLAGEDSVAHTVSTVVTGGTMAAAGNWQGGAFNAFGGASSNNYQNYAVSNGAHLTIQALWNDGTSPTNLIAAVTGIGSFSYVGSAVNMPVFGELGFNVTNYTGSLAFVNLGMNSGIDISGNGGGGNTLGLGLVGPSPTFWSDTTSPADTMEFLNGFQNPNPGVTNPTELSEIGSADPAFLTTTLNQMRTTQPALPVSLPSGVTDVSFYRVYVSSAATGIHLEH